MKTSTKRIFLFTFLSVALFFLGDIISPVSNLITQLKTKRFEQEIVDQAYSVEKSDPADEKVNWRF